MARPIKNKANTHHKKPINKAKKSKSDGLVASDVYEAVELSDRRKGHDLDEVDNLEYDAGEIDEKDDEEIDSDEAFDESDEERFEGYKFRGSTKASEKKHLKKANKDNNEINMDEDESDPEDESDIEDEGDFVDLSQMLDGNHEDEDDMDNGAKDDDYEDEDEEEFKGFDDIIDGDDEEDDDASDSDGLANFVEGLETKKRRRNDSDMPDSKTKRRQLKERNEAYQENEFNLNTRGHDGSNKKISLNDLMSTVNDESTFGSLKEGIETLVGKGKHLTRRALDAPLPKRIQDRMERQAALANTTEEISKWQPTVQMTRAAEHLSFPLQDSSSSPKDGRTSAALASKFKAETTLEQQVQQALADAGMKDEELEAFEALKLNKLTVAEVEARRRELRMMRELMFRSEIKNKRLKKIKSKSYRKLKRKEKEKITSQVQETSEVDFEEENEDKMKAALSRAEERMTLKHKNTSKWAKRALARGVQDEGTREAIMEQLRRGEELRRKIEGSESEDDSDDHDDAAILEEINSLKQDIEQDTQPQKGILSMKFMQDAAKRQSDNLKNEIDEFEKEWLAPDSDNEDKEKEEDNFVMISNNPGRMAFGAKAKQVQSNDEPEQEVREEDQFDTEDVTPPVTDFPITEIKIVETATEKQQNNKTNKIENKKKEKKTKVKIAASSTVKEAPVQKAQPKSHKNNDDVSLKAPKKSVTFEQRELVARAFADDDVVAEFEEEKLAEIAEDGDKVEDLTLPGWGAWAGAGVKPKKNKKKIIKITKGIAADKRRDAKLAHVIINEKANKKVTCIYFVFIRLLLILYS
ncbi:Utp14-domain-containing protein [Rhizopus microsporus var. microsporus]|nr:Utp14-domain-containing protein [Rhizopus microsporus var. microsporus]